MSRQYGIIAAIWLIFPFTYSDDNAPGVYWSVLECDIFIISACLPSIRSISLKMFPRFFGTKRGTNVSGKYYRHNDRDSNNTSSSHHLKSLSKQGKILKSIDLHISHESRENADDKELLDPPPGHVYGVWGRYGTEEVDLISNTSHNVSLPLLLQNCTKSNNNLQ